MAEYAVGTVGFAVEFAWASGEATVIPYLVEDLRVRLADAALVFAVNPCVALFLQPLVGRASDALHVHWTRVGGRVPFLILFSLLSTAGIWVLLTAEQHAPACCIAVVCFAAFGLLDVSHDVLLIPSRALVSDLSSVSGTQDSAHATFSTAQALGRLSALSLGAFPQLYVEEGAPSERSALTFLMGWAMFFIVLSCVLSVLGACVAQTGGYEELDDDDDQSAPVEWDIVAKEVALQCAGWVGFMVTCFYWTQYVGMAKVLPLFGVELGEGMTGLCVGAFSGVVSGALNTWANERWGVRWVYTVCLGLNGATLLVAPWVSGWWAVLALIPQGMAYPVHQTNGQLIVMDCFPVSRAGLASSTATYSITLSQIVTAVFAASCGAFAFLRGLQGLFTVAGLLCIVSACISDAFPPRKGKEL